MADPRGTAIDDRYRAAWPRLLGALTRDFGSVELAEDCLQEACLRALAAGALDDPVAWIATTARRLAIDEVRRAAVRTRTAPRLVEREPAVTAPSLTGDDLLDLLVLACHRSLAPAARMPLALRFVLGASTESIADAFGIRHTAMSARLTRAKHTLDEHGRLFTAPDVGHRAEVLQVISVLYTLGHTATVGDALSRPDDRLAALDLARAARVAWPDETEAEGLLALLLLTEARQPARLDPEGRVTTLQTADRSRWDRELADEGLALAASALPTMGRFALQAGIAGLHTSAASWEATDWPAVVRLYDRLLERWPSPAARIARAVGIGYGPAGPDAGLAELDQVDACEGAVARQHAAARADLLRLAGHTHEAKAA